MNTSICIAPLQARSSVCVHLRREFAGLFGKDVGGLRDKDAWKAHAIVDWVKSTRDSHRLSKDDWEAALEVCCIAAKPRQAEDLLRLMRTERLPTGRKAYNLLLGAYARKGDATEAVRAYQRMAAQGLSPNLKTHLALMQAVLRAKPSADSPISLRKQKLNAWDTGFRLLADAVESIHTRKRGTVSQSFAREPLLYSTLLSAAGMWTQVVPVLELMKSKRCEANVTVYNTLLKLASSRGSLAECDALRNKMQRHSISPNVVTFTTLVSAHKNVSDWKGALAVLHEMQRNCVAPNSYTLAAAVSACAKCPSDNEAVQAASNLSRAALLRGDHSSEMWRALMSLHVAREDKCAAQEVIRDMQDNKCFVRRDVAALYKSLTGVEPNDLTPKAFRV
ncbi:Pentatricopeptide repeat-containing protein [Diplonema papillatum]|nr:Pentatricopeptide repeat-containing protein [Diplonema papillatum]